MTNSIDATVDLGIFGEGPGGRSLREYLNICVGVDHSSLSDEYMRLPADYAFWNEKYAAVYAEYLQRKSMSEQTKSRRRMELREVLVASGEKVSEARLDSEVSQDEEYIAARFAEIDIEAKMKYLHGILDVLRTKRDMLISLGAHQRAEMSM